MKQLVVKVTGYVYFEYPDKWGKDVNDIKMLLKEKIDNIKTGDLVDVDKDVEEIVDWGEDCED